MSSGLVKASKAKGKGKGLGAVGAAAPAPGGTVRSSNVSFSGTASFFKDFTSILPKEATSKRSSSTIAEGVTQHDNRSAIRREGNYFQRKHLWQVTVQGVTIWEIMRPLQKLDSGALKVSGEWYISNEEKHECQGVPTRRHGTVPYDKDRVVENRKPEENDDTEDSEVEQVPSLDPSVLGYLPSVVQRYATSQVSSPTFTDGEIWQYANRDGMPYKQTIELVRLNADKAVVILASKEVPASVIKGQSEQEVQASLSAQPWVVTQSVFTFTVKASHAGEIGK